MSRRLRFGSVILLFVIWAGVLLTPKLRLILRSQIHALRSQSELDSLRDAEFLQVLETHPDDPRVLALSAETGAARKDRERRGKEENAGDTDVSVASDAVFEGTKKVYAERKAVIQTYDQLNEKFPHEAWLIQNRLRLSTFGNIRMEHDGIRSQSSPQPTYEAPTWLDKKELLQAVKIAERGARLEPQNSFYDWMRAIFLFGLKRDEDALEALRDGSRKTDFDDGVLRDVKNRIAVRQIQNPLLWEERFIIMADEILPHLSFINRANRAAVWHGANAERKGDHARALKIYESQWKLGKIIARQSSLTITSMLGQGIMYKAWRGTNGKEFLEEGNEADKTKTEKMQQAAAHFAQYARRHGRPDLAREAEKDAAGAGPFYDFAKMPDIFQVLPSGHDAREIYRWKWNGVIVLKSLSLCGIAWLFTLCLQGITKRREKQRNEKSRMSLDDFDVIAAALFVALSFGTALFVTQGSLSLQAISDWMIYGNSDLLNRVSYPERPIEPTEVFSRWLPFIPLALTLSYGLIAALWRGRKTGSTPSESVTRGCGISAFLFMVISIAITIFVLSQLRLVRELSLDSAAIKSWLPLYAPVLIVIVFWLYLAFRFGLVWLKSLWHALSWLMRSQLVSQTLLTLLVALSGVYLFTSVASLPIRREANARLYDFLARGEVAVLRDVAKKHSP